MVRARPVLHLFGSPTSRFWSELSLTYARGAYKALSDEHRFLNVLVLPDGSWRVSENCAPQEMESLSPLPPGAAINRILDAKPDCALPQMFCREGMVEYRGLIEALGIPLIGNRGDIMAIAADKAVTRSVMRDAGIRVPHGETLRVGDNPSLEPPFVVKPALADNSEGISLVTDAAQSEAALAKAFRVCERVIVEAFVPLGREVRAGVVEIGGRAVPLPLEEYNVDPDTRPIRLPEDKIDAGSDGDLKLMAKTKDAAWIVPESDPLTKRVQEAALACHEAIGARDYSLFDFRIDPGGTPYFLEAGPYCSFSPDSVLAVMMDAAGTPLSQFFAVVRDQASRRIPVQHHRPTS